MEKMVEESKRIPKRKAKAISENVVFENIFRLNAKNNALVAEYNKKTSPSLLSKGK